MDFRKVYEPWEIRKNADSLGLDLSPCLDEPWLRKGFIDGNNSGSASLDYAGKAFLFRAVEHYFPGFGFSLGYVSPGGIHGIAGRLAYSDLSGMFTMVQDGRPSGPAPGKDLPRLGLHVAAHVPDL
jgi:L-fucose isomerase